MSLWLISSSVFFPLQINHFTSNKICKISTHKVPHMGTPLARKKKTFLDFFFVIVFVFSCFVVEVVVVVVVVVLVVVVCLLTILVELWNYEIGSRFFYCRIIHYVIEFLLSVKASVLLSVIYICRFSDQQNISKLYCHFHSLLVSFPFANDE